MRTVFGYLKEYGNKSFEEAVVCDGDYLVLCRLSYALFNGVVPNEFSYNSPTLGDAVSRVIELCGKGGDGRRYHMREDRRFLKAVTNSARYSNLHITAHAAVYDREKEEQFSATTFIMPDDSLVITFRGTDGTIIGWKEDFNMCFTDIIPAQSEAIEYTKSVAAASTGDIHICGHSKGGNLAVYTAAFSGKDIQRRVIDVYNMDGPGFNEKVVAFPEFAAIKGRVKTFIPQSSIIGMLLGHSEDFIVIRSSSIGILQHNLYSWMVGKDGAFIRLEGVRNSSQFIDSTLKEWVAAMTEKQREQMIDGIFAVVEASECTTFRELFTGKSAVAIMRAAAQLDEETRIIIGQTAELLKKSMKNSFPPIYNKRLADTRLKVTPQESETPSTGKHIDALNAVFRGVKKSG